jgi:LmbE family N-acetylglucosaminyl deacetylase
MRQCLDLRFNAARSRRVAIADVRDSHARKVRHNVPVVPTASTLVFLHAHPDDEALLTSGTMARASAEGHRVILVMATDGAAGLTSAAFASDLGARRRQELEASAQALGVHRLERLGHHDSGIHGDIAGGFATLDPDVVAADIAERLNGERCNVIVGYDKAGGYGHPDHRQVHRVGRRLPALLHPTPALFEVTLPREPIVRLVHWATRLRLTPPSFDPREFDAAWTPRRGITHRVDVRAHLSAKRSALLAHLSQTVGDGGRWRALRVLTALPRFVQSSILGTEYYVHAGGARAVRLF